MPTTEPPKILLDCDVIIHFMKGGRILELTKIFPGRFVMLDKVQNELHKRSSNIYPLAAFLAAGKIPVITMPTGTDILKEYVQLKKLMDDGEAACLSVAKFNKQYVASSNITQIKEYCMNHEITIYTTMDLLEEATVKDILTDADCEAFIREVKAKGSRLPCDTMPAYRKIQNKETIK